MSLKTSILTLAAAGAFAASANAALITQTEVFAFTPTDSATLTFDQYSGTDPLLSVEVIVSLTATDGSFTVDNDGGDTGSVTIELGADGALSSSDVNLLKADLSGAVGSDILATSSVSGNVAANDSDLTTQFDNDGGPDNLSISSINVTDGDAGFISPFVFGDYIGAGTFDLDIGASTFTDFSGISGLAGSFTAVNVAGFVTVNYVTDDLLTPIPEPEVNALIGISAIASLLFIRRFRKAKKQK